MTKFEKIADMIYVINGTNVNTKDCSLDFIALTNKEVIHLSLEIEREFGVVLGESDILGCEVVGELVGLVG